MIDEKRELDEKLIKLDAFTGTEIYTGLSGAEQHRLHGQAIAMRAYSHILGQPIAAFTSAADTTANQRPNPAHGVPHPPGHNPVG